MKTIRVKSYLDIPINFTGVVEYLVNGTKYWHKEGKWHREDGPAIEYSNGNKSWYIEGKSYVEEIAIAGKFYLGKEKGKYDLEWFRFLTEEGIEEYPNIPGIRYKFLELIYS